MSEVIAALLGGIIGLGIYFAITETIAIRSQRRFFRMVAEHECNHPTWNYDPWTGEKWMVDKKGDSSEYINKP